MLDLLLAIWIAWMSGYLISLGPLPLPEGYEGITPP